MVNSTKPAPSGTSTSRVTKALFAYTVTLSILLLAMAGAEASPLCDFSPDQSMETNGSDTRKGRHRRAAQHKYIRRIRNSLQWVFFLSRNSESIRGESLSTHFHFPELRIRKNPPGPPTSRWRPSREIAAQPKLCSEPAAIEPIFLRSTKSHSRQLRSALRCWLLHEENLLPSAWNRTWTTALA